MKEKITNLFKTLSTEQKKGMLKYLGVTGVMITILTIINTVVVSLIAGLSIGQSLTAFIILFIIASLGGLGLSFANFKRFFIPIFKIRDFVDSKMERKNVSINLEELGILKSAGEKVNELFSSLSKVTEQTKETLSTVDTAVNTLEETSEDNVAIAEEMLSNIKEISTSASVQQHSVRETSIAMQQMSAGIQQIATSSSTASDLATTTNQRSIEGNSLVNHSLDQMQQIQTAFKNIENVVRSLEKRSKDIENFVGIITKIASETNMLAMNASIEAAHAGEFGRGFSVVAEEVRRLSQQSDESAKLIQQTIFGIQEDISSTSKAVQTGSDEVNEGMDAVTSVSNTFNSILESISELAEEIENISSASQEMAAVSEQVTASAEEISSIVEQNAGRLIEVEAAAEAQNMAVTDMTKISKTLKETFTILKETTSL